MKLSVQNFRSIKNGTFDLAPITVFYGPNGSGKSTVLYALLTFKNIVMNPNQRVDGFFDYGFLNLGGFESVIFNHQTNRKISFSLLTENNEKWTEYSIALGGSEGTFQLDVKNAKLIRKLNTTIDVSFPYSLNKRSNTKVFADADFVLTWNGVHWTNVSGTEAGNTAYDELGKSLLKSIINDSAVTLLETVIVPLKRGFTKPSYSSVPVSAQLYSEDEIATLLSANKYLVAKVSHYLETITSRDFRLNFFPGTAVFSLDALDKKSGISSDLVNEGFGINQLVHLLSRCLAIDVSLICIDEPEIHLHPSAVRALAQAFVKMTKEEGKRFVIATHSEVFISTLLAEVARGNLKPNDLSCYLTTKEGKQSKFEKQEVNEKGQISGGLQNFAEAELENLQALLGINKP